MTPELAAALAAIQSSLNDISAKLTQQLTFLGSINGQVSAFDQIMLHFLAHVSHVSTLPKPPFWDSVVASFGLVLPWGND